MCPVRCFTCGKVVADQYDEFKSRVDRGEQAGKVLTELGLDRYCCRRMLLGQVDLIEEILPYQRY